MPMPARTSATPASAASSDALPGDVAANDSLPPDPLPTFVLTPELRARIAREAARVPADAVKPMGSYASEQVRWAGGVLATAWSDLAELMGVPIGEQSPLTRGELITFGEQLEYARERVSGDAVPLDDDPAGLTDAVLQQRLRAAHVTLADAIPLYLCGRADEAAEQARVTCRTVRAEQAKKSISGNGARLNLLLDSTPALGPWLGRLPKGEAAALDTLRRLHPEWVRREQLAAGAGRADPSDEGADRAWALMARTRERILTAGRYLVGGRADREGAYRAFSRPAPRKTRKAEEPAKGGPAKGDPSNPATKPGEAPANDAAKPVTG